MSLLERRTGVRPGRLKLGYAVVNGHHVVVSVTNAGSMLIDFQQGDSYYIIPASKALLEACKTEFPSESFDGITEVAISR